MALLAYPRVYGAFVLWAWLLAALAKLGARDPESGRPEEAVGS
jgi:hypothetical protein